MGVSEMVNAVYIPSEDFDSIARGYPACAVPILDPDGWRVGAGLTVTPTKEARGDVSIRFNGGGYARLGECWIFPEVDAVDDRGTIEFPTLEFVPVNGSIYAEPVLVVRPDDYDERLETILGI